MAFVISDQCRPKLKLIGRFPNQGPHRISAIDYDYKPFSGQQSYLKAVKGRMQQGQAQPRAFCQDWSSPFQNIYINPYEEEEVFEKSPSLDHFGLSPQIL